MKKRKAALYDPYIDTLGGGERHVLSILKVLEEENYEINIFWDKDLNNQIRDNLSIQFNNPLKFLPNIFRAKNSSFHKLKILSNFDIFFYISDGSYFFSSAKKNFVYSMIPKKDLYPNDFLNKIKTFNYRFFTHSKFAQQWLSLWCIKTDIVYPYLDNKFIDIATNSLRKDKIILSVGRFFKHLHNKRQDLMINLFKKIKQKYSLFKDFQLILAGGLKEEDNQYFKYLKQLIADDNSITLLPNLQFKDIFELYKKSLIYWHLTGFGINENQHPEQVEHLGITPLEAMSTGCITFCYNAGGPKEIINHSNNGFLFNNEEELLEQTYQIIQDKPLQKRIQLQAKEYVVKKFNYEAFRKRVKEVILK